VSEGPDGPSAHQGKETLDNFKENAGVVDKTRSKAVLPRFKWVSESREDGDLLETHFTFIDYYMTIADPQTRIIPRMFIAMRWAQSPPDL
jgi:hypothetical protein